MGRRRAGRTGWPPLSVPTELLEALAALHGPLDDRARVKRIAAGMSRLHFGLTRDRDRFIGQPYLADPLLRLAYSTYVVCAQAPKLSPVLDRLTGGAGLLGPVASRARPLTVLEFGCGPGTGVAGMWAWARGRGLRWRHHATDLVPQALGATRALAEKLGVEGLTTSKIDLAQPLAPQLRGREPADIVLMMNVVNELAPTLYGSLAASLGDALGPDGALVVIEPAAAEPSRRALAFRDALVDTGWAIRAPCPASGPCPALAAPKEWCHDSWTLHRPAFMAAVDALVGTRRETLKATWFIADRRPPSPPATIPRGRVVSDRFEEKGRSRARVCTAGELVTLELQRRDRSPLNGDFARLARFSLMTFSGAQPIGDALRLGAEDEVRLIREAD